MNDQKADPCKKFPYIFSPDDFVIVSATKELLWKIVRSKLPTAKQLEIIAQALQVFEALPSEIWDFEIKIELTGPRRTFGSHEIYHWWHVEIEHGYVAVTSGGHFYRPSTGGDTFSSLIWKAAPVFATEHHDYFNDLSLVDDVQPFPQQVEGLDFSHLKYTLEVYENGEDVFYDNDEDGEDDENEDEDDSETFSDGDTWAQLSFQDAVKLLESGGVECTWLDRTYTSLYSVDLNEIELTDAVYKLFEKIPLIKNLEMRNSDISDRTLVFIKHLKSLEWLCLRNTNVTDEGLRHLNALQSLKHLDLIGTTIIGPGLIHLRHLSDLRELYISGFQHRDKWLEMLRSELPLCEICLN